MSDTNKKAQYKLLGVWATIVLILCVMVLGIPFGVWLERVRIKHVKATTFTVSQVTSNQGSVALLLRESDSGNVYSVSCVSIGKNIRVGEQVTGALIRKSRAMQPWGTLRAKLPKNSCPQR